MFPIREIELYDRQDGSMGGLCGVRLPYSQHRKRVITFISSWCIDGLAGQKSVRMYHYTFVFEVLICFADTSIVMPASAVTHAQHDIEAGKL